MIGVIGPKDSVSQVMAVAAQINIDVPICTRIYDKPDAVLELAEEIDPDCTVILFTGRVPYAIATASRSLRARLEYIPHEGLDLMRELARTIIEFGPKRQPRISLDSIDSDLAAEVFVDLGVPVDRLHPLPLVLYNRGAGFSADQVAKQHQQLHDSGVVDVCLTCLDSVYVLLKRRHVPVRRVTHARLVVRTELERCVMASQLTQVAGGQVAVALLTVVDGLGLTRRQRSLVANLAKDAALATHAELVQLSDHEWKLVTTRGEIERCLSEPASHRLKLQEADFAGLVDLGVGLGDTVHVAELNAQRAIAFTRREGRPFMVKSDGQSVALDASSRSYKTRDTRPEMIALSNDLGLSPLSVQRLVHALQQTNSSAVTATQLATEYGVASRSARRLLGTLVSRGYATAVGTAQGPGAGRPQMVYRIELDRMLQPNTSPGDHRSDRPTAARQTG